MIDSEAFNQLMVGKWVIHGAVALYNAEVSEYSRSMGQSAIRGRIVAVIAMRTLFSALVRWIIILVQIGEVV